MDSAERLDAESEPQGQPCGAFGFDNRARGHALRHYLQLQDRTPARRASPGGEARQSDLQTRRRSVCRTRAPVDDGRNLGQRILGTLLGLGLEGDWRVRRL